MSSRFPLATVLVMWAWCAPPVLAQVVTQRGFVEGVFTGFPQEAVNDTTQAMGDFTARTEVFVKPTAWLQFVGGLEARANSHDQVADEWAVNYWDRGELRPRLSVRRLAATISRGPFTVDLGKQFVRWGTTDLLNPTDRFAPRDFMNVVNADFLGITAARAVTQLGRHTVDVVWAPRLTPSRLPLADQRWAVTPPAVGALPVEQAPVDVPEGSQIGVRWGHTAGSAAYSLSFFNGHNYQPDIRATARLGTFPPAPEPVPVAIDVTNVYPAIRTYGGDLSLPVRWVTLKVEAAYFSSRNGTSDDYGLYVLELERQSGEWVFVGGYAGEAVTHRRVQLVFAPDRGASRSFLGRAQRSVGVSGSVAVEGAVRQNGDGAYAKAEFSRRHGQHWRTTATVVGLGGKSDDFFGQYRRNSHATLALRYSF